jgi:beta-galactosidase/beta-glucuronidase
LNFEACDWETVVSLNGKQLGGHKGGYDSFTFDITKSLNATGEQELRVEVTDPSDSGDQPSGKQMIQPRLPFFSACSGIWQSVWIEPVPMTSIESLKLVPDIDRGVLEIAAEIHGSESNEVVEAIALAGDGEVSHASASGGQQFALAIPNAKLWSPDDPFLYGLKVTLSRGNEKLDTVTSYFGMRKISIAKDEHGFPRLMLNNRRLFQIGPLDQGYWPEGIYTAPTDEALRFDIETMRRLGFNMCRKHVKIEPERWYYWCDQLGLLVWQDMPNGGGEPRTSKAAPRSPESARQFEEEMKRMVLSRGNHPCIVVWTAFNQGWGQYDTERIVNLIKSWDSSRLVIDASGWNDVGAGDIRSLHLYPGPAEPEHDGKRACVIGECGALGLYVPRHMWFRTGFRNVTMYHNADDLTMGYLALMSRIQEMAEHQGLSGAVITQLTDVESEPDGFMTYDRKVLKIPVETVKQANEKLIRAGSESN